MQDQGGECDREDEHQGARQARRLFHGCGGDFTISSCVAPSRRLVIGNQVPAGWARTAAVTPRTWVAGAPATETITSPLRIPVDSARLPLMISNTSMPLSVRCKLMPSRGFGGASGGIAGSAYTASENPLVSMLQSPAASTGTSVAMLAIPRSRN